MTKKAFAWCVAAPFLLALSPLVVIFLGIGWVADTILSEPECPCQECDCDVTECPSCPCETYRY